MKIEDIQLKPFECHQSSISTAHGCNRCWFYKERWGVILRGVKVKEGADLGKIYHKFQHLGPGRESEVRLWVRKIQTALMARVNKGEDLDGQMVRQANLLTTLYYKAEVMAHLFWERYPTPDYLRTIGTEIKHKMILESRALKGLVLTGTIDKLIVDIRQRNGWCRDHKSTGRSLDTIFAGFPWSTQARIYRILLDDYCCRYKNGFPLLVNGVIGFILDGILKPGIKLCKKDTKNAKDWNCSEEDAYLRRAKEWYAVGGKDTIRSQAIVFNEPLYPQELINELMIMQELGNRGNDHRLYTRDPSRFHCFLYDSQCIYYDLCSSPKVKWEELFETKYKIREGENES